MMAASRASAADEASFISERQSMLSSSMQMTKCKPLFKITFSFDDEEESADYRHIRAGAATPRLFSSPPQEHYFSRAIYYVSYRPSFRDEVSRFNALYHFAGRTKRHALGCFLRRLAIYARASTSSHFVTRA